MGERWRANNASAVGKNVNLLLLVLLLLSRGCCYLSWKVSPVFNEVPESSEREAICILKCQPEVGSVGRASGSIERERASRSRP